MNTQHWLKPAIKSNAVGCPCCPSTEPILCLTTVLHNGYGGWCIQKNGQRFHEAEADTEWEIFKTLADIEEMIGEDNESEYTAVLFSALRGATYQRHSKNNWVLIETNEGFA